VEAVDEPLLSVRNLAKRYGEREALRDVGFDLRGGELVAVVGPNGAGKTTLLSILAGVQQASAGTVGGSAGGAHSGRAIGWAPQQPALYSKLSVQENLRLFARLEQVADPDAAVARMLEQTGLGERAHELVERLSGGNRQRVNVALGLIADPPVLALDEPSSALDPGQRARLWEFVGALAERGRSVLFSTHHLGEVRRYATRAIVLADGEVLFDGTPGELVAAAAGAAGERDDFEGAFLAFLRERGHG
jgi:ABC-2 type transport system ATP-binding protein